MNNIPIFKTTKNILNSSSDGEFFNENWMDHDQLVIPINKKWKYERNLNIEDIDLWEVIYESSLGFKIYAAYDPYAEFYLTLSKEKDFLGKDDIVVRTFEGINASKKVYEFAKSKGIKIGLNKIWVDPEEMWLYPE